MLCDVYISQIVSFFMDFSESPNLLLVGAGGIGCEIIKSLALTGTYRVTVVDFDTISLSNLSRQFFYSEVDIGKEKSITLAENAMKKYSNLQITGISGNVLDDNFDPDFVKQFDFVFCGVDNIDARMRISQLCVITQTPFIDCASSGKHAQSVPTIPFKSACYICSPVAAPSGPKVTCTIRSTPQTIEHCSAWSFHLFNAVFSGQGSNDVVSVDNLEPQILFDNVFGKRIEELRAKTDLWKSREPPTPLTFKVAPNHEPITRPTEKWTLEESVGVFADVVSRLKPPLTFEKDDEDHLAFATAATNLQAAAFHIDKSVSMFDNKGLVAVVVPALATTNSIISGIAVQQMRQILNGNIDNLKSVWMSNSIHGPKLTPVALEPPSKNCSICGYELWHIECDYAKTNISQVANATGIESPSVMHGSSIIYDVEDTADRLISDIAIRDSVILVASDIDDPDNRKHIWLRNNHGTFNAVKVHEQTYQKPVSDNECDYSDVEIID